MKSCLTLNQNHEFRRVYGRGKSYVSPLLVVYVLRNRGGYSRYGITVSKKVGKAVKRNRAKRVITAAFFRCLPNLQPGWDIVFVARGRTVESNSNQLYTAMESLLKRAGVLQKSKEVSE